MYLIDTTLRDGAQTPGLSFTLEEKIQICSWLEQLGVEEVETGIPAMGANEISDLQCLASLGHSFRQLLWCRCLEHDLQQAARIQTEGVHISLSTSTIHERAFQKRFDDFLRTLPELLSFAQDHFAMVSIGAQDASRTPLERLYRILDIAESFGASRVRIADTVGVMTPLQVQDLIGKLREHSSLELEFHGHNDLGMATANALTAIQSGCSSASTTLLGIGERAGNTPTEELITALSMQGALQAARYDLSKIQKIGSRFSSMIQREIAPQKPLLGSQIDTHESGIHTRALSVDRSSYQALPESLLKKKTRMVFGTHSGRSALKHFLDTHNIDADDSKVSSLLMQIQTLAREKKSFLSGAEVLSLFVNTPKSLSRSD